MANKTTNYGLNKHSPQDFYNVEARNENWDKIDEALAATDPTKITAKAAPADGDGVMIADSADGGKAKRLLWSSVKTALGKLFVPLARKINGKTLAKDVTLTAADIKMPNSEENVGAAMAKRPLAKETLTLAGDINAKSAFPYGKSLVFRTTNSDWGGNMPSDYAAYAKLRSSLSGSYDMWFGASDCRFWFARAGDDAIPARNIWYELARCVAPEVHSLPLNIAGDDSTCYYAKDQFGRVYVSIRTNLNANWNDYKIIGTLPEGFQPVWDVVTPLLIQNDPISYQIGQIVIQPGGNIYVHGSFTSAEYIFAQLTYPASV